MAGDGVPAERQQALLEHGPDMLSLVLAMTPLRFAWVPGYADYYPEAPGGLAAGRSIEPVPLDGRVLGGELAHLGRPYLPSPDGVAITQADYRWLTLGPRHPRAIRAGVRVAGRAARTRLLGHRDAQPGAGAGGGLAGRAERQRGAGLAGHPDDRPGGTGRPGERGPRRRAAASRCWSGRGAGC